jgi:pimeloyl-ACP methyl ester carboxylesterase
VAPPPAPPPSAAGAEPGTTANDSDAFAEVDVEGDLPIYVLRGADGRPPRTIFLTGSCTHPLTYTTAFRGAARAHGGLVALQGDQPCKGDPTLRRWSPDTIATSARIDAALRAAGAADADTGELTLMGYSQGAERAEWLARRFPAKYTRFVLMAGPVVPSAARLAGARAVATLAGYGDVRENMADGARRLRRAKIPASYFELPGVHHGELSPAVDEVVARAFDWLDATADASPTASVANANAETATPHEATRAPTSPPRGARAKRGHAR